MPSVRFRPRFPRPRLARFRRRPINLLPSVLTTFNLYWGTASILASMNGRYENAAIYIFIAMVFDGLDGAVARLTHSTSLFGKELDGLCDMVSFGLAPALLIYHGYILGSYDPATSPYFVGSMLTIGYVICGALRLARFSAFQYDRTDAFVGLPTPAAAVVVASFVLFANYFEWQVGFWVFMPLLLGLSLLMVSAVGYPKWSPRMLTVPPRRPYLFLVLCVFGIVAFHYAMERSLAVVLLPLALLYVAYGLLNAIHLKVGAMWNPAEAVESPPSAAKAADGEPTHPEPAPVDEHAREHPEREHPEKERRAQG